MREICVQPHRRTRTVEQVRRRQCRGPTTTFDEDGKRRCYQYHKPRSNPFSHGPPPSGSTHFPRRLAGYGERRDANTATVRPGKRFHPIVRLMTTRTTTKVSGTRCLSMTATPRSALLLYMLSSYGLDAAAAHNHCSLR